MEATEPKTRSTRLMTSALQVAPPIVAAMPAWFKRLIAGGRAITVDGNTLDASAQLMLFGQRISGAGGLSASGEVEDARALMHNSHVAMNNSVQTAKRDFTIPGPAGALKVRHYQPDVSAPAPLLVFFHGGGFVVGNIDTHDGLCRKICHDAAIHVLSVDYRLAPEHPAPAAADDCVAAFRWAREHSAELGADPSRIGVGGDSAGGTLSALVALRARDEGFWPPTLQVLIYPGLDLTAQTRSRQLFSKGFFLTQRDIAWFVELYLRGSELPPEDAHVSPLRAADLTGLAPALVLTAGFDPLRDEGNEFAAALRSAGVSVDHRQFDSLTHGFASIAPFGGDSARALSETISAIRAHLSRA